MGMGIWWNKLVDYKLNHNYWQISIEYRSDTVILLI